MLLTEIINKKTGPTLTTCNRQVKFVYLISLISLSNVDRLMKIIVHASSILFYYIINLMYKIMKVETEGEHSKQRNINSKVLPTDRDKYTEVEVEVEVEALRL